MRSYGSQKMLVVEAAPAPIEVLEPASKLPTTGIVDVTMPRKPGAAAPKPCMPRWPAIIDWLAVDKPAHARYQPATV